MIYERTNPTRRSVLAAATIVTSASPALAAGDPYASSPYRALTAAEWSKRLPPEAFDVLRREGTEAPFSSGLNDEHRRGVFVCLGCGLPLFRSEWKYNSGS
jgi:peptide-methionine (R)-S-oxide reductase